MTAILTEPAAAPRTTKNHSQRPPRKQSPAAGQPGKTRPQSSAAPVQDGPPEPVSGLLDFTDGRAFLRRAGYQRGPDDVLVSQAQVQQFGLRQGDAVDGDRKSVV
jgi:transcription termination factor Rho